MAEHFMCSIAASRRRDEKMTAALWSRGEGEGVCMQQFMRTQKKSNAHHAHTYFINLSGYHKIVFHLLKEDGTDLHSNFVIACSASIKKEL